MGGSTGGGGFHRGEGTRGYFSPAAIYCTTTWCFALKGLRTTSGLGVLLHQEKSFFFFALANLISKAESPTRSSPDLILDRPWTRPLEPLLVPPPGCAALTVGSHDDPVRGLDRLARLGGGVLQNPSETRLQVNSRKCVGVHA